MTIQKCPYNKKIECWEYDSARCIRKIDILGKEYVDCEKANSERDICKAIIPKDAELLISLAEEQYGELSDDEKLEIYSDHFEESGRVSEKGLALFIKKAEEDNFFDDLTRCFEL